MISTIPGGMESRCGGGGDGDDDDCGASSGGTLNDSKGNSFIVGDGDAVGAGNVSDSTHKKTGSVPHSPDETIPTLAMAPGMGALIPGSAEFLDV